MIIIVVRDKRILAYDQFVCVCVCVILNKLTNVIRGIVEMSDERKLLQHMNNIIISVSSTFSCVCCVTMMSVFSRFCLSVSRLSVL